MSKVSVLGYDISRFEKEFHEIEVGDYLELEHSGGFLLVGRVVEKFPDCIVVDEKETGIMRHIHSKMITWDMPIWCDR